MAATSTQHIHCECVELTASPPSPSRVKTGLVLLRTRFHQEAQGRGGPAVNLHTRLKRTIKHKHFYFPDVPYFDNSFLGEIRPASVSADVAGEQLPSMDSGFQMLSSSPPFIYLTCWLFFSSVTQQLIHVCSLCWKTLKSALVAQLGFNSLCQFLARGDSK